MKHGTISFTGRSGLSYCFQVWPLDTKFKGIPGVYMITKRVYESKTFQKRASHAAICVGQTANLAAAFVSDIQREQFRRKGATSICVHLIADEAERVSIETDLMGAEIAWGGLTRHVSDPLPLPEAAPEPAVPS
jgi:hypothetical protein